jgi:hypothetical protein
MFMKPILFILPLSLELGTSSQAAGPVAGITPAIKVMRKARAQSIRGRLASQSFKEFLPQILFKKPKAKSQTLSKILNVAH